MARKTRYFHSTFGQLCFAKNDLVLKSRIKNEKLRKEKKEK